MIASLPADTRGSIRSIAIDGTSSTALLCNRTTSAILEQPKMYNESQGQDSVNLAAKIAPASHTATASSSTLCKLLTWHIQGRWQEV